MITQLAVEARVVGGQLPVIVTPRGSRIGNTAGTQEGPAGVLRRAAAGVVRDRPCSRRVAGHNGSHNDLLRRSVEEDTRLDEARSETMEEWM